MDRTLELTADYFKTIGKHEFSDWWDIAIKILKDKAARCMLWISLLIYLALGILVQPSLQKMVNRQSVAIKWQ